MRYAASVLAVLAVAFLVIAFGFVAWRLWFGGADWHFIAALVATFAAISAGQWSEYLSDLAKEA